MSSLYRDPRTSLQSQVASKRGQLASLLARLPPLLRALAPAPLAGRLDRAPVTDAPLPDGVDELGALDATLDDVLAAFFELEQAAPRLRRCPHDVEPFRRPDAPPPWLLEERGQLASRARFTALVHDLAPEADVIRWGDHAYVARFAQRGNPVLVRVRFEPPQAGLEQVVSRGGSVWAAVRSSVPETMSLVTLRQEGTLDNLAQLLRLRREVEVGDSALDDAFWVEGDARLATALAPTFAEPLLALLPNAPELAMGRGVVELRWSTSVSDLDVLRPLGLVLAVREAFDGG